MSAVAVAASPRADRHSRRETLGRLARSKTFAPGALIVLFWVFWAIVGSHLTPHDPLAQTEAILKPPGSGHWLGTDQFGRDVLSRVLAGARNTMQVAPLATLLGIVGGTALGLVMGYFLGLVDEILGRIIDAFLALPLIVIAVTALFALGSSQWTLIAVIGAVFTPIVARTVRATVLGERNLDYVQAARLRGEGPFYVMFVEILPNIMGPIIVEATVRLGYAIFAVAGLTFLGFGVQPPNASWGVMLQDAYSRITSAPWPMIPPGVAIALTVLAFNLVGDGLRDSLGREVYKVKEVR